MTFAFVPPADGHRLTQLRMALLLRLRRSLRRAGASVHGLKARAAAVARSAHSVVGTVRRRVHNAVWSRAGWLLASMKLLRRGSAGSPTWCPGYGLVGSCGRRSALFNGSPIAVWRRV